MEYKMNFYMDFHWREEYVGIFETKYDSLIVLKNNLWSDYQSDYDSYVNTLSSRNEWANIYNLLAEGKVCDREQLYQFIIENPL